MLERALLQPKQISLDPLDNALQWGISIWPLDKILKWLDKVSSSTAVAQVSSQHTRLLDKPFIKLESSHRHCPTYKEFSAWPTISLDFETGGCPFSLGNRSSVANVAGPEERRTQQADTALKDTDGLSTGSRMTRKARSKLHQDVCTVALPGYCEICQVKYCDQNTHVQSDTHLGFIKDDCNFVSLDLVIKHKSGMDAFLQLNGASELMQCSMLANPRRSLRSILKLSSLDTDSQPLSQQEYLPSSAQNAASPTASPLNMRQTLEDKHLSKVTQHHQPLQILCNGMVNHNYETRHGSKVPAPIRRSFWDDRAKPRRARTTSATFCSFGEEVPALQLSPTGSDVGHRLRSRGHSKPVPADTSADEDDRSWCCDTHPGSPRCPGDRSDQLACVSGRDVKSEACKPCRGNGEAIRKKRPSAEEKLIEDNKAYYKLELKNSKLRSSRYFIPHKGSEENCAKTDTQGDKSNVYFSSTNGDKIGDNCASVKVMEETAVKVKKKQRRTELSVLSDEAESFMFGEPLRHDGSFEFTEDLEPSVAKAYDQIGTQDAEAHVGKIKKDTDCDVVVKQDGESNSCLTPLPCDESSLGSIASSCDTGSTRRKRRTHAEAFIHDNLDYYKFEIPGSRLRYQGGNSPNTSACKSVKEGKLVNTNEASVQVSLSPSGANVGPEEGAEVVPSPEGADSVKDVKEEERQGVVETCVKQSSSYAPVLQELQYSFEFVPESEPWYQTYKRQDEGDEVYFPQCESVPWRTFLLPYEMSPSDVCGSSVEPCSHGEASGLKYKKKKNRRNRYAHLLESKPRKSPRCHASTLAILSSLRHHRRRKEVEKQEPQEPALDVAVDVQVSSPPDESSQDASPTEASCSKNEASEPESAEPFGEIERNFEKVLAGDEDDSLSVDIQVQDCELMVSSGRGDVQTKCAATGRRRGSHPCRRKSVQASRKLNGANSRRETTDAGPVIRRSCKERSMGTTYLPTPRSGLDADVLELLGSISSCGHFEKDSSANCRDSVVSKREAVLALSELSCNSSECSLASTCDSSFFSDVPSNNSKCSMKKKKKRKKNLTGWPIERHRKKGMKKVGGEDEDCKCGVLPCNLDASSKAEGGVGHDSAPSHVATICMDRDEITRTENSPTTNCAPARSPLPNVTLASADEITEGACAINGSGGSTCSGGQVAVGTAGSGEVVEGAEEKTVVEGLGCCAGEGEEHSPECGAGADTLAKHGPTRTVSLETSRASCEYQPCVRVMKMTNLANMLGYSQQGAGNGAGGRRLRSASSPSSVGHECQQQHHVPRRASPRKKVPKVAAWDTLISKRR